MTNLLLKKGLCMSKNLKKIVLVLSALLVFSNIVKADDPYAFTFYENFDWTHFFDSFRVDAELCQCDLEDLDTQYPLGFKMRFAEPIGFWNTTNMPLNFEQSLGIQLDTSMTRRQGYTRSEEDGTGFRYADFIIFPILGWTLGTVQEYVCFERGTFLSMGYLSRFDPSYNNDVIGLMVATGAPISRVWFSNPVAEVACVADCAAATFDEPLSSLFYCDGCRGSVSASDTGYVKNTHKPYEASEEIVFRAMNKMHTYGGLTKTSEAGISPNPTGITLKNSRCDAQYFPLMLKGQYHIQVPYWDAEYFGKMRFHYDFKSMPQDRDDVFFWLWRYKDICLGATKCRSTFTNM